MPSTGHLDTSSNDSLPRRTVNNEEFVHRACAKHFPTTTTNSHSLCSKGRTLEPSTLCLISELLTKASQYTLTVLRRQLCRRATSTSPLVFLLDRWLITGYHKTAWDRTAKLTKSIQLIHLLPYTNKAQIWAYPVLEQHFTLPRRKMHIKRARIIV